MAKKHGTYLINPGGRRVHVLNARVEGLLAQGYELAPEPEPAPPAADPEPEEPEADDGEGGEESTDEDAADPEPEEPEADDGEGGEESTDEDAADPEPEEGMTAEEFAAELDDLTKPELIEYAELELDLELSMNSNKDELIAAIMDVAQ